MSNRAPAADAIDAAALDEAAALRAADAWNVLGFSVWETVQAQIAAEPEEATIENLRQTVRDLQSEVSLLREEVRALQAAPSVPASQTAPRHTYPPRLRSAFARTLPASLAPFLD